MMKFIPVILLLSGCCALKYPLDGKAQSWCNHLKTAQEVCATHGGLDKRNDYTPYRALCADGTSVEYRK